MIVNTQYPMRCRDRVVIETDRDGTASFEVREITEHGVVFWCLPWQVRRTVFWFNAWHFPEHADQKGPRITIAPAELVGDDGVIIRYEVPDDSVVRLHEHYLNKR
jgi:hypothetical protein